MTEEFLHHVWKFRLFDNTEIRTTQNDPVEIITVGEHNHDAGPDFFNAKIKIGNTLWAGNVEIHTNSSDWEKHNHSSDKAYDNIILHVVHNEDSIIRRKSGEQFPTLILKDRINKELFDKYHSLKTNQDWIPCGNQIRKIEPIHLKSWLERLVIERMETKSTAIIESLRQNRNNWEETFYQLLARNFGFKINSEPFHLLAKSTPLSILSKHKNSLLQIEAILFGQSGLLEKYMEDKYAQRLQNEYVFLYRKFDGLKPIELHLWKLLRLRPSNFPAIRIAQFAALIFKSSQLFSKIIESDSLKNIYEMFDVRASDYWDDHYTFEKISRSKKKSLGRSAIDNIVINTVTPFLFAYGKEKGEEKYIERAIKFLEDIDAESNSIIEKWESLGLKVISANASQALLQLKNEYCQKKRCLHCAIGNKLLSSGLSNIPQNQLD